MDLEKCRRREETLTLTEPAMRRPQAIISIIRNTIETPSALTTTVKYEFLGLIWHFWLFILLLRPIFRQEMQLTWPNRCQIGFIREILRRYHRVNIFDENYICETLSDRYGQAHPSDHATGRKQIEAKVFPNGWHFGTCTELNTKNRMNTNVNKFNLFFAIAYMCWIQGCRWQGTERWMAALFFIRSVFFVAVEIFERAPTWTQISVEWCAFGWYFVMGNSLKR